MLRYIKIDTCLIAYMQFIFSFYQDIARSFMLFSFIFPILMIAYYRLFWKIM